MAWTLRYSKRARRDAELLQRSGLGGKTAKLLEVLIENPFSNPPPYEKLSGALRNRFSRRINRKHRILYEVLKDKKIVTVLQMWTHYE